MPGDRTTSRSVGSAVRMRLSMLVATLFAFVLASLAVVLAGGFGAQPANAQADAQTSPWAWGENRYGQLGDGTNTDSFTPVQPSGLRDVIDISAATFASFAVTSDKTVWAWGDNQYGTLGDGTNTTSNTPVQVSGLTDVKTVAGYLWHTLAVKNDGTVWAWGHNGVGQLGNGTNTYSNTPVQVRGAGITPALTDVKAVAAGANQSLALKNDGTVWAWGSQDGGLGTGFTGPRPIPAQVRGLTDVKAIAAGHDHSLAVKNDGTVWAWGSNFDGQLGNGTNTNQAFPVQVSGLTDVKAIGAGDRHSAALKNDGTVYTWGWNEYGQLGDGTNTTSNTPVQVSGLSGATHLTLHALSSAVLKSDGTAWAWGDNFAGQLGNGTNTYSNTPVRMRGLVSITKIDMGGSHTLALAAAKDTTPPSTTSSLYTDSGAYEPGKWTNKDVQVTFSAQDDEGGSGVEDIRYSASGAQSIDETVYDPQKPPVINTEGITTIDYYATDKAGNVEEKKSLTVNIDKTPPQVDESTLEPKKDATGVSTTTTQIKASFSEVVVVPNDNSWFTVVSQRTGKEVPGTPSYDPDSNTATFTLDSGTTLNKGDIYTATIKKEVTDEAGNAMAQDYPWRFTTAGPKQKK